MRENFKETEITYPHVIFRLCNELFSISGKYVSSIQQFPDKLIQVPHVPDYVRGTFSYLGKTISLVDLRALFGWPTVEEEYQKFSEMIDHRKQDHLNWVRTLEECLEENKAFPLATDFHQCALGRWRDRYETQSDAIAHHLKKIDPPHRELHAMALEAMKCSQDCENCAREECQKKVLKRMTDQLVPQIIALLDEAKDMFKDIEYREMVLVLNGERPVSLLVDDVIAVDDLIDEENDGLSKSTKKQAFIHKIQRYNRTQELIMELDIPLLESSVEVGEIEETTE